MERRWTRVHRRAREAEAIPLRRLGHGYIMVLASERPLLEAFRHATTGAEVADRRLRIQERGAAAFMGQAVEYEIATWSIQVHGCAKSGRPSFSAECRNF